MNMSNKYYKEKCAKCGYEFEPFYGTICKCPYSHYRKWVCVYCCKKCQYVKRMGTAFGCELFRKEEIE